MPFSHHQHTAPPRSLTEKIITNAIPLLIIILVPLMDPEVIRTIYPPLHYLTMGMIASAMVYLFLGMDRAVTIVLLSLVDTAVFVRVSGPVFCVWVAMQVCLMGEFIRYAHAPFFKNLRNGLGVRAMTFGGALGFNVNGGGGAVRAVMEWFTRLARWLRIHLQRLFRGTREMVARTWKRLNPKPYLRPRHVPVAPAPEGREEGRLQSWEQDLQELEIYLVETEEELRSWDKRLRERDDNLRELEGTLREWEDGLREALEGLKDQGEGMGDCEGEKTELGTFYDEF